MNNDIERSEQSFTTLTEVDIQSLITWHDDENPRLTPIGSRCLTNADIDLAVQSWRQANGYPQVPIGDWWQRSGKWLQGPNLAGLDFSGHDLQGKDLDGIILSYANLQGSKLREASLVGAWLFRANLQEADCYKANMSKVNFLEANLTETEFWGAKLCGARFTGAVLERTRLLGADLSGAYFRKSRLNQTEMVASQLGDSIGEEIDRQYFKAAEAYTLLKANFESLGRYTDAGWAYRKERRMKKMWAKQQAQETWTRHRHWEAIKHGSNWIRDWLVELLCDYGESAWRVIGWLAVLIFIIGPLLITLSGGLEWTGTNRDLYFQLPTTWQRLVYGYFQHLLYTIDTLTTANFSELRPHTDVLRIASGCMALSGIFLVGLLGFVAGNRIRNS